MRYTESDRLSSNVEDRRHEGEEGIAGKLFRETFDYLRQLTTVKPSQPKPDEQKPEPKSKDQSPPLGVGSEGVGSEVQLPQQSMDIGQNCWTSRLPSQSWLRNNRLTIIRSRRKTHPKQTLQKVTSHLFSITALRVLLH